MESGTTKCVKQGCDPNDRFLAAEELLGVGHLVICLGLRVWPWVGSVNIGKLRQAQLGELGILRCFGSIGESGAFLAG